jgi:hypothetical protein
VQGGFARGLNALEAILGTALFFPDVRPDAATAGLGLMTVFAVTLIYARVRRLEATCMCFGGTSEPITMNVIARDVGLVLVLWIVSFGARGAAITFEWTGAAVFLGLLIASSLRTSFGWIRREA